MVSDLARHASPTIGLAVIGLVALVIGEYGDAVLALAVAAFGGLLLWRHLNRERR